jgi:FkbM family methyltransferase
MRFISYAQNYEDVMLARAFRDLDAGFYIDVGAQDPRFDSVTKAFYDRGWHGINIEPVEYWHQKLCQDRPRDINLCLAAGAAEGTIDFHETTDSGLSTASAEFARRHRERGLEFTTRQVAVRRLDTICAERGVDQVHFLKVDVEGAEEDVLRGIDLTRLRPWVVLVEATEPNSRVSAHAQWEHLIVDHAYRFVYQDGLNRFYLADEHADLADAFAAPPNIFDEFIRREYVDAAAELSKRIEEVDALSHRRAAHIDELVGIIGEKDQVQAGLLAYQAEAEAHLAGLRDAVEKGQSELRRRVEQELSLTARLLQRESELSQRDLELSKRDKELQRHGEELQRRNEELLQRDEELARRAAELRQHRDAIAALSARLEQSERSGARLSRALLDAQSAQHAAASGWAAAVADHARTLAVLSQAEQDYQAVLSSRSWRLTQPLRWAMAIVNDLRTRSARWARSLAHRSLVRRLAALILVPFPRLSARIKHSLYGEPLPEAVMEGRPAALPISDDAEAILARFPVGDAVGSDEGH